MNYNILIAEDDTDITELLSLYLGSDGYHIHTAQTGLQALDIIASEKIDCAVIDIMMPEMNGYDLLQKIRETNNFPVIILSARNLDSDKILGLNLGADAYLTKPFNPLEVTAYVRAALRRCYDFASDTAPSEPQSQSSELIVKDLRLDLMKFVLYKKNRVIPLTPAELKIVMKLMQSPGRVYTKAQLYTCIGGEFYDSGDKTMMEHISNIRGKIEEDPSNPQYIKTVRGLGYKIEAD